jgi:Protein of unknown function, DUF481
LQPVRLPERVAALVVVFLGLAGAARAQRTDVVRMANGDRITGEVKKLDRGQLEFKTDDVGTIYFEWDKIVSLEAKGQFYVSMSDGRQFVGSLSAGDPRSLVIVEASGPISVPTYEVTLITPIGASFWKKLDGSVDVGFSYTRSSQVAQLNVNSNTLYRRPAFEGRLNASGTFTQNGEDGTKDDRGTIQASYVRFRGERLFVAAGGGVESNESLGLLLRTQIAVTAGPRLVNTNRAQFSISAGLSANDEQAVDAESTQNLEGLVAVRTSYYRYDRPRTNVDLGFQYYPSLSNFGRQRIQLDASAKREFWKDVFFSINMFDTFDSRPPNASADKNDVGVSMSFGWTY